MIHKQLNLLNTKLEEIYIYEKSFRNKINIYQKIILQNFK